MSSTPNAQTANIILLLTGIIGAFMPIASKIFLAELTPIMALFITLVPMVIFFIPTVIRLLKRERKDIWKLVIFGFLWTGNITFFLFGIKTASSFISQILYSLVPVYLFIYEQGIGKSSVTKAQIFGIFFGVIGISLLSYGSFDPSKGIGSLFGIFYIWFATLCWSLYIILSKRLSNRFRTIELTGISSWCAFGTALLLVFTTHQDVYSIVTLSLRGWIAIIFAAIVIRIVMIFLYNWGIKYGTTIVAATSSYIGPPVTFIIGWMLLGEKGNVYIYFGAVLLFISIFLTNTVQLLEHKRI